jgi:Leucine-rich repeat (LRR) protein
MSSDSLQERLLSSPIVLGLAAIVGFVLTLATLAGLFGVEHYTIRTSVGLEQGTANTQSIGPDRVDPSNEGKSVHLTGEAATGDTVTDPDLGISARVLRLARGEVELYQWIETKTKKDKKEVVTVKAEWSKDRPKRVEKQQPPNPTDKPYKDATFNAQNVKLGAFTLPDALVQKLDVKEALDITPDVLAKLNPDVKDRAQVDGEGRLFISAEGGSKPDNPKVGDVRLRYKVFKPQTVTVVAKQTGSSFEPYQPSEGEPYNLIKPGTLTKEAMFESAQSSAGFLAWVLRVLCFLFVAFGLFLLLYRQAFASSGLAPTSILSIVAIAFLAFAFAVSLMLAVAGIRWLGHRPGIGTGLLVVGTFGIALLILMTRIIKVPPYGTLFGGGKKWTVKERELFRRTAMEPDNAQVRMQLAALLEKNRNPMGEFIRINQELNELPEGDPARESLDSRWSTLLDSHGQVWFAPLRRMGLEPWLIGHFYPALWMTNGVIDKVSIDRPGILPEKAKQLFDAAPALRVLEFHNCYQGRTIAVSSSATYKARVPAIVGLPQMEQIGVIDLSSMDVDLEDVKAIATSPYLENLTELNLSYNKIGPEGAAELAKSANLPKLRVLQLRSCDLTEQGAALLARSAHLANLVTLELGANAIGKKGTIPLASSAHLKNLQTLALDDNELGPVGAQAVAASPHWRQLTSLDLGRNDIGPEGAAVLAKSANLARLTTLKLSNNKIGAGLRVLAVCPQLINLKLLELESNELTDEGVAALATSKMNQLEELLLSYNQIGDAAVKALAAWPGLARVTKLNLRQNKITAAGIKALAASPYLRALKSLDLSENDVGVAGAQALAGSQVLENLETLWIQEAKLTSQGEIALRKRFGDKAYLT